MNPIEPKQTPSLELRDVTAVSLYTSEQRARMEAAIANLSVDERAARIKARTVVDTPPAQTPDEKPIRVHDCFEYSFEQKPARCRCNLYITRAEADDIISRGEGTFHTYEKMTHGVKRVCTSKSTLILFTSESRRAEIAWDEQVQKNVANFERRKAQREATFQSKLVRFVRDFKRHAYRIGVREAHQFTDAMICTACEHEGDPLTGACTMAGLISEDHIPEFYGLLSRFWCMVLDRENLTENGNHTAGSHVNHGFSGYAENDGNPYESPQDAYVRTKTIVVPASTGRGDRAVGSNQRFIMGGSTSGNEGINAFETHMVGLDGAPVYGDGRASADGAAPDGNKGRGAGNSPEPNAPPEGKFDPLANMLTPAEMEALKDLKVHGCSKVYHLGLVRGLKSSAKPVECPRCQVEVYPV